MAAVYLPQHNLTYVHIPKTGGTSITNWLMKYDPAYELKDGHHTIHMLRRNWDIDRYFTVVRNPWDRLVSMYHFMLLEPPDSFYTAVPKTFDDFLNNLTFDFSSKKIVHWFNMTTNQSFWIDDNAIVLRTESLNEDFKQIQDILNCSIPLPHENTTMHTHYRDYYNTQQQKLVADVYAEDIELFKYTF